MDSIFELQRRTHEEIERLEQAIVDERMTKSKTHKERLIQEHRVSQLLDRIQNRSQFLLDLYRDEDGARKREIDAITGVSDFAEFYSRLRDIKDYHRRAPNTAVEPMEMELQHRDLEKEEEGRPYSDLPRRFKCRIAKNCFWKIWKTCFLGKSLWANISICMKHLSNMSTCPG